ncbi:transcription factor bHLH123 [Syzygium oleosum]|uniref:transcription factor bHLH123 n=1 Tax=Syzygium oleosum TaxID=219896 RepID=UPI0024BB5DF6|nr:transcription factor bHLH123 [Syzygium oleosum]
MADDQFHASGNWWDASRNRYESGTSSSSSSGLSSLGSFGGWLTDMGGDMKAARSSMESAGGSSVVFHDTQKLQPHNSAVLGDTSGSLVDPNLHMMNLGLSSQAMDWNNQNLLRGDHKGTESSFRSMLQENLNMNASFQSTNTGDHSSTVTCQGFHHQIADSSPSSLYGSPSTFLQGILTGSSESSQQQQQNVNYPGYNPSGYNAQSSSELLPSNWSNKMPQFLRISPPKHHPPPLPHHQSQLHFSNNAPFWTASATAMNDVRSTTTTTYFPPSQAPFAPPGFDEKPKNLTEAANPGAVMKKSGGEPAGKRPRNETPSPLPAFKVRKEKMGDRITALQQLVSPFGKTDTASVLTEAIEYIKFLHDQISVLTTPYMKNGGAMPHQQTPDKSEDPEGPRPDLRSRGLCLVPVSSTYPVTHDTTVDFWTPTFGGTFR